MIFTQMNYCRKKFSKLIILEELREKSILNCGLMTTILIYLFFEMRVVLAD